MRPMTIGRGQLPTIRRAVPADADDLAALGRRTFGETFAEGNDPDDLAAYLDASFTVAVQHAELIDSGVITLVVESDSSLLGYAQVRRLDPPAEVTGPAPIQLRRFYLAKSSQGLGLGRRLLEAALASARELGGETLWLTVWERNERAIAFYERSGFRAVGTTTFVVGTDVQTDLLMAIALA